MPDSDDSLFGDSCHEVLEWSQIHQKDTQYYQDDVDPGIEEVKLDLAQYALDEIRARVPLRLWDKGYTEQRVFFGDIVPSDTPAFGTGDAMYPDFEKRNLYLFDAKFGYRFVSAHSPQLLGLAYGAQTYFDYTFGGGELPFDTFSLTVLQPTIHNYDNAVYTWDQLKEWGEKVCRPKIEENHDPKRAKYDPDAGVCTYCRARAVCPARAEKLAGLYPDGAVEYLLDNGEWPVQFEDRPLLTDKQVKAIYPDIENIESLCENISSHVLNRMANGTMDVPGFSLGKKNTHMRFADGTKPETIMKDLGLLETQVVKKRTLATPAQVKKQLPAGDAELLTKFDALTFKPEGAPVVKRDKDNKDPFHDSIIAGFKTRDE